jgi:hypothetical protein
VQIHQKVSVNPLYDANRRMMTEFLGVGEEDVVTPMQIMQTFIHASTTFEYNHFLFLLSVDVIAYAPDDRKRLRMTDNPYMKQVEFMEEGIRFTMIFVGLAKSGIS